MAISNEVIIAGLTFLTAVVGLVGGAVFISRRQKNKNSSKNTVRQSGIGKVNNTVGNVGSTFNTEQKSDEGNRNETN